MVSGDDDSGIAACRLLRAAQAICGGPQELARQLLVDLEQLNHWLATDTAPPREVFDKALHMVLDHYEGRDRRH
jgi:hypothetical protein